MYDYFSSILLFFFFSIFFYFFFSSSSSSLLHNTIEARAMFWGFFGLKTARKMAEMKNRAKMTSFWTLFV